MRHFIEISVGLWFVDFLLPPRTAKVNNDNGDIQASVLFFFFFTRAEIYGIFSLSK